LPHGDRLNFINGFYHAVLSCMLDPPRAQKEMPGPSVNSLSICTTCTTLSITCYGFSTAAKSSWLDGQTPAARKERAEKWKKFRTA
jgi:hypothetical protein